jgi:hypothetical protein
MESVFAHCQKKLPGSENQLMYILVPESSDFLKPYILNAEVAYANSLAKRKKRGLKSATLVKSDSFKKKAGNNFY